MNTSDMSRKTNNFIDFAVTQEIFRVSRPKSKF